MTGFFANAAAAAVSAIALAATSVLGGADIGAYDEAGLTKLSRADLDTHAMTVFMRADRNADGVLSADEFATYSIATAELAQLNGFVVFETVDGHGTVALPLGDKGALGHAEQVRIDAVARSTFYEVSGDGAMTADEFRSAFASEFDRADRNRNSVLAKRELTSFAMAKSLIYKSGV